MADEEEEVDAVPKQWLQFILQGFSNTSIDIRKPHLRPAFRNNYMFFIFVYGMLVIVGLVANFCMLYHIIRRRLYNDSTHCFIINLAISDIMKCVFVLPITLAVLLIQNWIFGQFLCFFLPMLQDIPLHVSMLTFLLIAVDRYRFMRDPTKPRLSAFVCATGTWFFAVCIVLPYLLYITYLDLETYQPNFEGLGVCVLNLADDMQEYMRSLFLIMYAAPLGTIAYLHVRSSRELQRQEGPLAVLMYEARTRHGSSAATTPPPEYNHRGDGISGSYSGGSNNRRRYDLYEAELDVYKEKRNQQHLITMVTVFAICLCPLMVLRLARLAMIETYENAAHFDITYTLLVWLGFLPACTTPCLFASWQMSRSAKERLRGYFRFSNRKLRHSSEDADSDVMNRTSEQGNASEVSYVHKSSNASSCQAEQLCGSS